MFGGDSAIDLKEEIKRVIISTPLPQPIDPNVGGVPDDFMFGVEPVDSNTNNVDEDEGWGLPDDFMFGVEPTPKQKAAAAIDKAVAQLQKVGYLVSRDQVEQTLNDMCVTGVDHAHIDAYLNERRALQVGDDRWLPIEATSAQVQINDKYVQAQIAIKETRNELDRVLDEQANAHINCVQECEDVAKFNKAQRINKAQGLEFFDLLPKPAIVPMQGFIVTTGGGKSFAIKKPVEKLKKRKLSTRLVVQNHQLADEHCARIHGAFHHNGRTPTEDKWEKQKRKWPGIKFVCHKTDDTTRATKNNHQLANTICLSCEHGFSAVVEISERQKRGISTTPLKISNARLRRAEQSLRDKNKKQKDVKPCHWLYEGQIEALNSLITVLHADSFSPAFGHYVVRDCDGEILSRTLSNLYVDENPTLAKKVKINVNNIGDWCKALEPLKADFEKQTKKASSSDEDISQAKTLIDSLAKIDAMFKQLQTDIINNKPFKKEEIVKLYEELKESFTDDTGALLWEKVYELDGDYAIVLRALKTLVENIIADTARQGKDFIVVYEIMPILQHALTYGSTVFMDATMSLAMKALIRKSGGKIHEATIKQNAHITMFRGHIYPKYSIVPKDLNSDDGKIFMGNIKAAWHDLIKIAGQLMGNKRAILTQINYLRYVVENPTSEDAAQRGADKFFKETKLIYGVGCKIGWWGNHHHGHNDWAGHNLAIVGGHVMGSDSIADQYGADRAMLKFAGMTEGWEEFNGVMDDDKTRLSKGGYGDPTQLHIKKWNDGWIAGKTAQAVGRSRAANSRKQIQILIYGGKQTPGFIEALAAHGVEIDEYRDNDIHVTREKYYTRGCDDETMDEAVSQLQAVGHRISTPQVELTLNAMGVTGASHERVGAYLTARRALPVKDPRWLPPASKGGRPSLAPN